MRLTAYLTGWILLLAPAANGQEQADKAVFQDSALGLSFQYPKAWKFEQRKHDWRLTIPGEGDTVATLEIFRAGWVGSVEEWELTQRNMNNNLRAETLRQWQEVILGVPLLLTSSRPYSPGNPSLSLQGLVYSKGSNKLLFRLTAPEASFDGAEFAVRKALESIRTLDGKLPQPEDPIAVPDPPAKGNNNTKTPPPPKIVEIGKVPPKNAEKAAERITVKTAGRDLVFCYPTGWKATVAEDGVLSLTNANFSGAVRITVASSLDSVSPARALLRASIASLKDFVESTHRDETIPKANRASLKVARVWRVGSGANGPLASFDAVCMADPYYAVISWKGPGDQSSEVLAALTSLLDVISLEPAG